MEVSFLQFQRNYKIKYFNKVYKDYFNESKLENKSYENFMKWCYTRETKKLSTTFCKALDISKANIKSMIKMVNLLVFSHFHPIIFENERTKEIKEISQELCELRNRFFDKCLHCSTLQNKYSLFKKEKEGLREILINWEKKVKEWRDIDKCMLVQDCIVHYVELMNLEDQLKENEKTEKGDAKKELNKITNERIIIEKEKCKDRVEEIDGSRGLRVMKGVLEHISNWEKSEKKLQEQIKTQMNKAFWDRIREDIQTEKFIVCQIHIKELVEDCATLFHSNVSLLDNLVDQIDFDFLKYRCENKSTDARFWYSIFIPFIAFLQECDAKQNTRIYESKIEELYLWTEQLTFERFKNIFFWIKNKIQDILDRKKEYETSSSYQDLKNEINL